MNRNTEVAEPAVVTSHPSFGEAFRFWLKLGFISFGGPTGQIAIMQTELVEKKRWISQSRFLHALNYCMLLPGPEAQQLATYIGWLLHKTWGGIVAGAFFCNPVDLYSVGTELHLCRFRQHSVDRCNLLRAQTGSDGDCCRRPYPHRTKSAQERSDVDNRCAGFRRDLLFQSAIPGHHSERRSHRIPRRLFLEVEVQRR